MTKCEHDYRLAYSAFGAYQGAICWNCGKTAPQEIENQLQEEKKLEEMKENRGPEMIRLLDRLYGDPKKRTTHFDVFPGPKWDETPIEEKAAIINKALDEIANGTAREIDLDD